MFIWLNVGLANCVGLEQNPTPYTKTMYIEWPQLGWTMLLFWCVNVKLKTIVNCWECNWVSVELWVKLNAFKFWRILCERDRINQPLRERVCASRRRISNKKWTKWRDQRCIMNKRGKTLVKTIVGRNWTFVSYHLIVKTISSF